MPQAGDRSLILRAKRGDRDAFGELVERYMGYVYGYAYARLLDHSDAEDATQDTFLRAYERLGQLREPDYFESWLMRIALSRTSQQGRWRRWETPVAEPCDAATPASEESGQEAFERDEDTRQLLDAALATLPETIRVPLVMRYLTGHSYEDIARALAVTPNAVERRVSRARARLRDYFRRTGARGVAFDAVVSATMGPAVADLVGQTAALIPAHPPSPARPDSRWQARVPVAGPAVAAAGVVLCGLTLAYWAGAKLVADGDSRQAPGVRPGSTAEAAILFRPLAPPMPPARALIREGSEADGWEAAWPQNDATVPQRELARRFSGGLGASVSNDHGVFRALPPAPGVVTMRVWIEPAMGPHTTSVGFVCEGQRTGVAKVCKDGTDRWGYAVGGQTTYVADARAGGHEVALVYRTGSATMDIRIDGAMVAGNVHYPDNVGKAVIGIIMASGRGGVGATTHFDDLSVHVRHSVRRVAPPVVMDYDAPPTLRDTVHLLAGEANGLTLAASDPVIRVRAGEVIRGSVTVDVHNSHGPAAGFVVVETPTWGVAQHSYRIVAASAPPAHSRHTVHLDRRAPAEPGTYFIIVAAAAETEGLYVASGTNWTNGEAVWGNGLEVASWRSGATSQAMRTGSVDADWLMRHGERSSRQLGAAAVKVIVGP